ncbi:anthrone oxygenase family protein [Saccharothrix coeruleofusca]|nr:anthrone oxygenase family protein [Saccharothrix coeruleofusca]MBP2334284.1 putative membrane protein [Saccharothrix coeruleofusca]
MFSTLIVIAALGSALVAGAFFVFSVMVMPALRAVDPAEGVAVMRSINAAAVRPGFLGVFAGTAVVSVIAAFSGRPGAVAGAALYVVGSFLLTAVVHVPRNNALERDGSTEFWKRYLAVWTAWNHVRALAALGATTALFLAV